MYNSSKKIKHSFRKLNLNGNMAQNQIKAQNNRITALNEQISTNLEYIKKLQKIIIKQNKEIHDLKTNNILLPKKNEVDNKDSNSLLYIMQA